MQVLPPVQLARPPRSWSSGAGGSRSRATAGPARNGPAPPSAATSAALPCAVSAGLPCGAVVGADVLGGPRVRWRFRVRAAPPRPRQARPSRTRRAMDPRRLGRDKRDPPVPGAQWTRAASVATSATLPCPARNGPAPPRSRQARPSRARHAMDPRRLGRDKRDPPVRRIRRVTMWCRGRGRRPRRPACPMASPCTGRSQSKYWSYLLEQRVASMQQ